MAEYINKSTLLRSFAPIYEHDKYTGLTFETAKQIIANHINSLPTIDIVRCKDCKHCLIHDKILFCEYWGSIGEWRYRTETDFCSRAERKDEVEE